MEGVDVWEPFIRELLGWFNSEEDAENEACLEAFCNFFGKTDNRMSIIIPHLMPYLFPLFSRSEVIDILLCFGLKIPFPFPSCPRNYEKRS